MATKGRSKAFTEVAPQTEKVLVAAIDFGTTYSGYAFSFKQDYKDDPAKISANITWIAGHRNLLSQKTPTCLLLKPDKSFDSFGYEAEDKYAELAIENKHLCKQHYFFKRFKMLLYGETKLNRDLEILDESGEKTIPARTVFAHGIRFLKDHLKKQLVNNGADQIAKDDKYIQYVLTVPAIWDDKAKQFMREAAREAGIADSDLSIALEPEAAALYCKMLPVEKLAEGSGSNLAVFQSGTKYMILDLGGGTVDVTVQEVLPDRNLKEIHKATGGAWGGTKVDESFMQLIISIVGNPIIQRFKKDCPGDDLELTREFEIKKRSAASSSRNKITLQMPVSLTEIFEEEYEEELKNAVKQTRYSGKLSWMGDKIRVSEDLIKELYKLSCESVVEHVQSLLQNPKCKDVQTLIMVGGFSECPYIQTAIKEAFSDKRIIIPYEAGLAVVKGAVLFGHNPHAIISRITKFTYGVKSSRNFIQGDPESKQFRKDGVLKCKDTFSKHVEIDTTVPVGEPLEPQYYNSLYKNSTEVVVPIYTSTEKNPSFVTDPTCTFLGGLTVSLDDLEDEEHEIEVKLTFGGTELIVEARETHSDTPCRAEFDFLSHHGQ